MVFPALVTVSHAQHFLAEGAEGLKISALKGSSLEFHNFRDTSSSRRLFSLAEQQVLADSKGEKQREMTSPAGPRVLVTQGARTTSQLQR